MWHQSSSNSLSSMTWDFLILKDDPSTRLSSILEAEIIRPKMSALDEMTTWSPIEIPSISSAIRNYSLLFFLASEAQCTESRNDRQQLRVIRSDRDW